MSGSAWNRARIVLACAEGTDSTVVARRLHLTPATRSRSGGPANRGEGTRSAHLFQSAVAQPQQTLCGQDLYETIGQKAAALAFSLAENQPFIDGNKRTAALALTVFLDINGHTLRLEHDLALAEVFEAIGHKRLDQAGLLRLG